MKKTSSTLSRLHALGVGFILGLAIACAHIPTPFPVENPVYLVDVGNKACAEYKIIDAQNMKFEWVGDHPLEKCQDVTGFDKPGFKKAQNWIRDVQGKPASFSGTFVKKGRRVK